VVAAEAVLSQAVELRGADLPFFHAGKNIFEQKKFLENLF
jgi:hypothetical protein